MTLSSGHHTFPLPPLELSIFLPAFESFLSVCLPTLFCFPVKHGKDLRNRDFDFGHPRYFATLLIILAHAQVLSEICYRWIADGLERIKSTFRFQRILSCLTHLKCILNSARRRSTSTPRPRQLPAVVRAPRPRCALAPVP